MLRRPPRSTLFPTRRSSDLARGGQDPEGRKRLVRTQDGPGRQIQGAHRPGRRRGRSEEHTSELQSRRDLVCRLLLEKKKKIHTTTLARPRYTPTPPTSAHPD